MLKQNERNRSEKGYLLIVHKKIKFRWDINKRKIQFIVEIEIKSYKFCSEIRNIEILVIQTDNLFLIECSLLIIKENVRRISSCI